MVIDAHVHVKGGDIYRREFSAEFILKRMDEALIDKSIVFAICLPSKDSNELTYREVCKDPSRLIGFAHVNPAEGDIALLELERAVDRFKFKGVKIHFGEFDASEALLSPFISKAFELGVPCLIDPVGKYDVVARLAETYPKARIIIAHLGSHDNEVLVNKFIGLAKRMENVFLETSWSDVPWKIGEAVQSAGADKVIFGSDGPLYHPLVELTKIKVLKLPKGREELILHLNIARLINEV